MYVNNIAERSSSRVLQRPGGQQHFNIFGGDDQTEQQPIRKTGRGGYNYNQQQSQQQKSQTDTATTIPTAAPSVVPSAAPIVPAIDTSSRTESDSRPDSREDSSKSDNRPAAGVSANTQQLSSRVNNIWGSDNEAPSNNRPTTRGRGIGNPGINSSGVAAALTDIQPSNKNISNVAKVPPSSSSSSTTSSNGAKSPTNRKNQTSINSPFSTEPIPPRSSTRVIHQPGGGGNGNILSWGQ